MNFLKLLLIIFINGILAVLLAVLISEYSDIDGILLTTICLSYFFLAYYFMWKKWVQPNALKSLAKLKEEKDLKAKVEAITKAKIEEEYNKIKS